MQAHLEECYQVPVSADVITAVTDAVWDETQAWQQRPLEPVYLAVALDGLRVKMRTEGVVQSQVVYLALRHAATHSAPPHHWRDAPQHIRLLFGDRVPVLE